MKDRKIKFRYFTIMEWKKEQDFLRQEGLKGWRFTKATLLGIYHFERCKPEDVVYQLDYNPDGIAHKEQYVQMFQDCGWEYIQDYFGYSYFRKPASEMAGDEEIFCDDESRLEMVKRIFLSRMVPRHFLFAGYSQPVYPKYESFLSRVCAELGILDTFYPVSLSFSGTWPSVLEILEKTEQIRFPSCSVSAFIFTGNKRLDFIKIFIKEDYRWIVLRKCTGKALLKWLKSGSIPRQVSIICFTGMGMRQV